MAMNLGNNFSARVVMRANTAAGPVRWANTHEFDASGLTGGLLVDEGAVSVALVNLHRSLLNSAFYVESVTLSSVAEDGQPYDPSTFYSLTAMLRGNLGPVEGETNLLPLVNCLHVKKAVQGGREGNLLLRGFLTESDIQSDPLTGSITLVAASLIPETVNSAWLAFEDACSAAGVVPSLMKVVGGVASQVRPVTGLIVKGHTSKKLNNKYFDKGSSPLGGLYEGLVQEYGPAVVGQIVQYLIESGGTVPLLP